MYKPIIGISMGDPAGIGPEICLKALRTGRLQARCRPVVLGDPWVMRKVSKDLDMDFPLRTIYNPIEIGDRPDEIQVLAVASVDPARFSYGAIAAENGRVAFAAVRRNIELALAEAVDATVTGPIHKESINLAGHAYAGHTEIYADLTDTEKYGMLLVEDNLRVIHVSTHVSLRQACDLVKRARVLDAIELLAQACVRLGVDKPRIGVAGLNPHASDGGLFGEEEALEIIPAIADARARGIDASGPVPPDTLFPKVIGGYYDGCVAMYHDQGHIPFKVVGFQWDQAQEKMQSVRGVNITLGLPIIRTSVDHGTAMEIAGQGIASAEAMELAVEYAIKLFEQPSTKNPSAS